MSFLAPLLATLIGTLTALQANKYLSAQVDQKTNEIIIKDERGKEISRFPNESDVRLAPFDIFHAFIKRVTTNVTSAPQNAQIGFDNPFKADVTLTSLSFVPDLAFQTKGVAIVKIGGNYITIDASSLTDIDGVNVPLPPNGIKFAHDEKIEIFAWNGVDATNVSLTMLVGIGGYLG